MCVCVGVCIHGTVVYRLSCSLVFLLFYVQVSKERLLSQAQSTSSLLQTQDQTQQMELERIALSRMCDQ